MNPQDTMGKCSGHRALNGGKFHDAGAALDASAEAEH